MELYKKRKAAGLVLSKSENSSRSDSGMKMKLKKKKVRAPGFFKIVYNFLAFCFEFILGFFCIGGSLVFESIPSCVYILINLIYMRQSVSYSIKTVLSKVILASALLVIAFVVLIVKIVLVFQLYKGSKEEQRPKEGDKVFKSFGIAFEFKD